MAGITQPGHSFLRHCVSKLEIGTHLQSWHLSVGAGPVHQIQCFVQLIVVENSKLGEVNQQEGKRVKGYLKKNF